MYLLEFWRDLAIVLCVPSSTAFVLIYISPLFGAGVWYKDYIGRALGLMAISVCLLTIFFSLNFLMHGIAGDYTGVDWSWTGDFNSVWGGIATGFMYLYMTASYLQTGALIKNRFFFKNRQSS